MLLPLLPWSADLQGFEQLGLSPSSSSIVSSPPVFSICNHLSLSSFSHSLSSSLIASAVLVFSSHLFMSLSSLIAASFLASSHFYTELTLSLITTFF